MTKTLDQIAADFDEKYEKWFVQELVPINNTTIKQFLLDSCKEYAESVGDEVIGEDDDISLKDLKDFNLSNHSMVLNQVHRQGRNELRSEQRAKLKKVLK